MSTVAQPTLVPIDLDDDGLTLSHQGAILARVYYANDFPCCDAESAEAFDAEQLAFAKRLRDSFNNFDALTEANKKLVALLKESRQYIELGASSAMRDGRSSDVGAVLNGLVNRIDAALKARS